MMNARSCGLLVVSLIALGCGLESQNKNQCAVQADCLDGYQCTASGTCEPAVDAGVEPCVPKTCEAKQCGTIDDGCQGTIECGCALPEVCEGAGVPNQCDVPDENCVAETDAELCAAAALIECGTTSVVDRCGAARNPNCGTCSAGTCGAMSHGLCDEIVCSSSNWCRALGGTLAGTLAVRDLWGNGQGEIWAAASGTTGGNSVGTVLRFDATRWSTRATGPHGLRAGAGTGNALWFANTDGDILTATGNALTPVSTSGYTWTSMHAVSATDLWVAGHWGSGSGAYARLSHYDGDVWANVSLGGAFDSGWHLLGVSAASSTSVWAVGAAVGNGSITDLPAGPMVVSYDGTSWTIDRTLPVSQYLRAVWAVAPNNVWAVGDNGTILHFDGTDWSTSASGVTQHLYAITGAGTTLWAAGAGGTILRKVGTGAWTVQQSGTTRTIHALWANTATDVWAGGDQGLLLRYQP